MMVNIFMDYEGFDNKEKASDLSDLKKVLRQVVCICKGIPLGSVLKACENAESVSQVNKGCGAGTGGCRGERCGPKIRALLTKKNGVDPGKK